jgi:hypothetical protein
MRKLSRVFHCNSAHRAFLLGIVLATVPVPLAGTGHHARATRGTHHSSTRTSGHASNKQRSHNSRCSPCTRNAKGKIKRSREAKHQFERQNPCPSTGKSAGSCPGYVVDHRKALAEGGADEPSNMQWQTAADAKAKDKWERKPSRLLAVAAGYCVYLFPSLSRHSATTPCAASDGDGRSNLLLIRLCIASTLASA